MAMHDTHTDWQTRPETAAVRAEHWAGWIGTAMIVFVTCLALFGAAFKGSPEMTGAAGTDDWHGNVAASGWQQ